MLSVLMCFVCDLSNVMVYGSLRCGLVCLCGLLFAVCVVVCGLLCDVVYCLGCTWVFVLVCGVFFC